MVDQKCRSKLRPVFLNAGALAPSIEAFSAFLTARGHTAWVVGDYIRSVRHFAHWLRLDGIALENVDDEVVTRFATHRCHCSGGRRWRQVSKRYAARVRHFVKFLRDRGDLPRAAVANEAQTPPRLVPFLNHLLHERGLAPSTAARHVRYIAALLSILGDDPSSYSAGTVRQVALDAAKASSRAEAKIIVTALRVYLCFLATRGECRPGLDHAVPTVPQWRLSALPRYLLPADVERVIASCDMTTLAGLRDRSILLLLARLGLRAGDVLGLRFDDLDWVEATLRVHGKGRCDMRLPLPQDAGDAVLAYLQRRRPGRPESRVFLRSFAPYRPFADSTCISSIVRRALDRAGIVSPPSRGANLLRHSAATTLLRDGATLDAVSALLRHRSADTTAHYAKVDLPMLLRVVQPWPEQVPC